VTVEMRSKECRIGFVVNPHAGHGEGESTKLVRKLLVLLKGNQLSLIEGTPESRLARELGIRATVLSPSAGSQLQAQDTAIQLLQSGVDVLIGLALAEMVRSATLHPPFLRRNLLRNCWASVLDQPMSVPLYHY